MTNFICKGETIEYTAGGTLASGAVVAIGSGYGVVADDMVSGDVGPVYVTGVFQLTSDTGVAYVAGDKLYWTGTTVTKTALANLPIGYAWAAKTSGAAVAKVMLVQNSFARAANVAFSAGSNLVGVDGMGSNAAPLAGTETRLDALDTAVAGILTSLKAAGLMANA